jgi:hypothetical protein
VVTVAPLHGVTFQDVSGDSNVLLPKMCQSLKLSKLRLMQKSDGDQRESDTLLLSEEEGEVVDCIFSTQEGSGGALILTCDWLATQHKSGFLRKRTPPGSRVQALLELELGFNQKNLFVKFEKELTFKVHSRDSEFSLKQ